MPEETLSGSISLAKESLFENKDFKQGERNFEAGVKFEISKKIIWVRKIMSKKDWNEWGVYTYSKIEDVRKGNSVVGVYAGFCIAKENFNPNYMQEMNDEEMRVVDLDRRSRNMRPYPLIDKDDNL
jgi:hypothetical protein